MKSNQYRSKKARCPYYHKHDAQRIYCDGFGTAVSFNFVFDTAKKRIDYMDKCCEGDYLQCVIAKAQEKIYGGK